MSLGVAGALIEDGGSEHTLTTTELVIGGMHCSACSNAVEAALRAVPGVQEASVSLVMRQATVQVDPARVTPVRPPAQPTDCAPVSPFGEP